MTVSLAGIIQVLISVVAVGAAAIWLRSSLVKQRHEELEHLAETRGHRIEDLEKEIKELRRDLDILRGQFSALQALKATEIASEVVTQLNQMQDHP